MTGKASTAGTGRVLERRRAVALARHYREFEGLSIRQIADRLGRSPATIKAYFYDPTGEKARAVKARYVGVCRGCGAYTQPRNGKGDAYAYCKACHPGAIERRWTRERVLAAMREWRDALRPAAVVVRLVAHARAPAWGRGARAARRRRVAGGERRHAPVRYVGGRPRGGRAADPGDADAGLGIGVLARSPYLTLSYVAELQCRAPSRRGVSMPTSYLRAEARRAAPDPGSGSPSTRRSRIRYDMSHHQRANST